MDRREIVKNVKDEMKAKLRKAIMECKTYESLHDRIIDLIRTG